MNMTAEQYLDRNLKALVKSGRADSFGPTFIQRHCLVGYNQALHTIDRGVERGILIRDDVAEWLVRIKP